MDRLKKSRYILEIEGKISSENWKKCVLIWFSFFRDNYGFVTFMSKNDAFAAIEHGNDDTSQPKVDLCFGGRRAFCKEKYADLGKFKSLKIKPFLAEIGLKMF